MIKKTTVSNTLAWFKVVNLKYSNFIALYSLLFLNNNISNTVQYFNLWNTNLISIYIIVKNYK